MSRYLSLVALALLVGTSQAADSGQTGQAKEQASSLLTEQPASVSTGAAARCYDGCSWYPGWYPYWYGRCWDPCWNPCWYGGDDWSCGYRHRGCWYGHRYGHHWYGHHYGHRR